MQVFLEIVGFSLQTDGSGRLVLTKGKRPKSFQMPGLAGQFCQMESALIFAFRLPFNRRQT